MKNIVHAIALIILAITLAIQSARAENSRMAIAKAGELLIQADNTFRQNASCYSCHHQALTEAALGAAVAVGALPLDARIAALQQLSLNYLGDRYLRLLQLIPMDEGGVDTAVYFAFALALNGRHSSPETDALIRFIAANQTASGFWNTPSPNRAPLGESTIATSALAIHALQAFGRGADVKSGVSSARKWIARQDPVTTQDRSFQLLGLAWSNASRPLIRKTANRLLQGQKNDGGWAQLSGMKSDSYATGQALYALLISQQAPPDVVRRAREFLLLSQAGDGSWFVRSRALPFQPQFDGGFPYGPDQWISTAATSWALLALATVENYRQEQEDAR